VDGIASILNFGLAAPIVQEKPRRDSIQRGADEFLRYADDFGRLVHVGARGREHLPRFGVLHFDAWLLHQLKGFVQNLSDLEAGEEFKFWSH
jgi:hypothetical protein